MLQATVSVVQTKQILLEKNFPKESDMNALMQRLHDYAILERLNEMGELSIHVRSL